MADTAIIDLKKNDLFIPQYVDLRNRYARLLLSKPVTVAETKTWLLGDVVEVKCLVENDVLVGAVVLYLKKGGEVALFVKEPRKGTGSELLRVIEKVAVERNLTSLWAWVLSTNFAAQKTFVKSGYRREGESPKRYEDQLLNGLIYRKMVVTSRVQHGQET